LKLNKSKKEKMEKMEKQTSAKLKSQREVVEKLYKAFETGNIADLEECVTKDYKEHNPDPQMKSKGIQLLKDQVNLYHTAFPDTKIKINDIFGDGEKLAIYTTLTGTNKGEMFGIPATNKKVNVNAIEIVKFEDGKISDHWGVYDNLAMFKQLGLIPETGKEPQAAKKTSKLAKENAY
jgi:steroid delta-isomerase-like uncharacterized protein